MLIEEREEEGEGEREREVERFPRNFDLLFSIRFKILSNFVQLHEFRIFLPLISHESHVLTKKGPRKVFLRVNNFQKKKKKLFYFWKTTYLGKTCETEEK